MLLILKMAQNGQAFKIYDAGNTAFLISIETYWIERTFKLRNNHFVTKH